MTHILDGELEESRQVQYLDDSTFSSKADADFQGYTTPGWYHWCEVQVYCYGPYPTMEVATAALTQYAKNLG